MATLGTYADIGWGVSILWGGNTYYLTDTVDGPSLSRDSVDYTHSGSTEMWRQFLPGLKDGGEISGTLNFDPNEPEVFPSDETTATATLVLTMPIKAGQTTGATCTVSAFVMEAGIAIPIEDRMTQAVTWKLTGKPTFADGS